MRLLKSGQGSPVARALDFGSTEAAAFVDVCYHAILGRAPDKTGLAAYADLIDKQRDREALIAVLRSIAMSQEARDYREHYMAHR